MTKARWLVVLLALNLILWSRAWAYGPAGLDGAEDVARKGCAKQGYSLRALMVQYEEIGEVERVSAVCGLPRLTGA